jgi:hypothetical protein
MINGQCQYRYNASETYQRTKPGMGPETMCGGRTYPAVDEPELSAVNYPDGRIDFRPTGRFLPRGYSDPYCPAHGGSPEPPPPPVSLPELEDAYQKYVELTARYQGGATPVQVPDPLSIASGNVQLPDPYQIATGTIRDIVNGDVTSG